MKTKLTIGLLIWSVMATPLADLKLNVTHEILKRSYEAETLAYDVQGRVEDYDLIYFSPLGLYGTLEDGETSMELPGTDALEEIYGESPVAPRYVFNWDRIDETTNLEAIKHTLYRRMINGIYQYATTKDLDSDSFIRYAEQLQDEGISLYLIYDEQDMNIDTYESYLEKVVSSRAASMITGIVTDVEPYSQVSHREKTPLEELALFYRNCQKMTNEKGMKMLNTIPVWYDNIDIDLCEAVVAAGDGVILMNYNRNNDTDAIANEVKFAKLNDIPAINAVEIGDPSQDATIEKNATYYGESLLTIEKDLMKIRDVYPSVGFCYHQLRDLMKFD